DGQADELAACVDRDDRDARREPAHDGPELIAADHDPIIRARIITPASPSPVSDTVTEVWRLLAGLLRVAVLPWLATYGVSVARHPRIEVPGGIYHVGSRGNRGGRIYADDYERLVFLKLLERVATRYRWTCHAYCLMANHYHLLISIESGLSDGMRELNGEFASFTNVRHDLEGHLFRNRFWSELIESEAHMLETSRYVVLNPIR